MRTISEEEIRSLKGATDSSYRLGGGVNNFPLMTRVTVSTLSKYASFNEENREALIPVDVAIEADRKAQSPVILSAMAHLLGYRLVAGEGRERRAITRESGTLVSLEVMDVVRVIHEALQDGKLDAADNKSIVKECDEAIRLLQQIRDSASGGA